MAKVLSASTPVTTVSRLSSVTLGYPPARLAARSIWETMAESAQIVVGGGCSVGPAVGTVVGGGTVAGDVGVGSAVADAGGMGVAVGVDGKTLGLRLSGGARLGVVGGPPVQPAIAKASKVSQADLMARSSFDADGDRELLRADAVVVGSPSRTPVSVELVMGRSQTIPVFGFAKPTLSRSPLPFSLHAFPGHPRPFPAITASARPGRTGTES